MLHYCKYFNQKGIFILAKSVVSHGQPQILQQNSQVQVDVKFKVIFFRPFQHEIILCQIIDYNENELICSTSFFNNIIVKNTDLFANSYYVEDKESNDKSRNKQSEKYVYVWEYDGNKFFFDKHSTCRCRVKAVKMDQDKMTIYASMDESGLGQIYWW